MGALCDMTDFRQQDDSSHSEDEETLLNPESPCTWKEMVATRPDIETGTSRSITSQVEHFFRVFVRSTLDTMRTLIWGHSRQWPHINISRHHVFRVDLGLYAFG